jgi:hypothetical protein
MAMQNTLVHRRDAYWLSNPGRAWMPADGTSPLPWPGAKTWAIRYSPPRRHRYRYRLPDNQPRTIAQGHWGYGFHMRKFMRRKGMI